MSALDQAFIRAYSRRPPAQGPRSGRRSLTRQPHVEKATASRRRPKKAGRALDRAAVHQLGEARESIDRNRRRRADRRCRPARRWESRFPGLAPPRSRGLR